MIIGDDLYITNNQQQSENGALLILSGWRPAAIVTPPPRAMSPTVRINPATQLDAS